MISRITPFLRAFHPLLAAQSIFHFSLEEKSQRFQGKFRAINKLDDCKYVKHVLQFMNNSERTEAQQKESIIKFYGFRTHIEPWQNLGIYFRKILQLDVSTFDVATLSALCGLTRIMSSHTSMNRDLISKIEGRISQIIKNSELLTDQNVINFYEFVFFTNNQELKKEVGDIMSTRMKTLKISAYQRYLETINLITIPTKIQLANFDVFVQNLKSNLHQINPRLLSICYRYLKLLNYKIWNSSEITKIIEEAIKAKLYELNEKEIITVIYNNNQLNKFQKLVYQQMVQSIDQQGNCSIQTSSFFHIWNLLYHKPQFKVQKTFEARFLKFLSNNLNYQREISEILLLGNLTKKGTIELLTIILESEYAESYKKNLFFLYTLTFHINSKMEDLVETVKNLATLKTPARTIPFFMAEAVIVDEYAKKFPQDTTLQELLESYKKAVSEQSSNDRRFFNVEQLIKFKELALHFKNRFRHNYLNKIVEKHSASQNQMPLELALSLFLTNCSKEINIIMKNNKNALSSFTMFGIVRKVMLRPSDFEGRYNFLHNCLLKMFSEQLSWKNRQTIFDYLRNWQVHMSLNLTEVYNFLKLFKAFIQQNKSDFSYNLTILTYLICSPNKNLRHHPLYGSILEVVQKKYQENARFDKAQFSLFVHELIRFNEMTQSMANRLLNSSNSTFGLSPEIQKYCEFLSKNAVEIADNQLTYFQILLILKAKQGIENLENRVEQINRKIETLRFEEVETILIHFNAWISNPTLQILNKLLQMYKDNIRYREYSRQFMVLRNLERLNLGSVQYKEFLKDMVAFNQRNISNQWPQLSRVLISQCIDNSVECNEFVERVILYQDDKIWKNQRRLAEIKMLIYPLFVANPIKTLTLLRSLLNNKPDQFMAMKMFVFADLNDQNINRAVFNLLKNVSSRTKIFTTEGIAYYLTNKIPELTNSLIIKEQKPIPNPTAQSLKKFCEQKNIKFELIKQHGEQAMKIGEFYLFFIHRKMFIKVRHAAIEYFTTVFGLQDTNKSNMLILFTEKRAQKKVVANLLSNEIIQFKDVKDELRAALSEYAIAEENSEQVQEHQEEEEEVKSETEK